MIQKLFLSVLDMSIVASIVILAVLVVRLFLKRAPKFYSYILWAVVLFRLLCPFSFESVFSIIPERVQNIPQDVALETTEYVSFLSVADAAQRTVGDVLNGGIENIWVRLDSEDVGNQGISMASHLQVWLLFAGVLWPIGIAGMIVYSGVSFVKLRRKLVGAVPMSIQGTGMEDIYLADHIVSPFVLGIIRPKIYLPSSLDKVEREYIILHEQHHIHRGDHIVKLLAFVALCIHWFNPLVWVAFAQAGKDMEMSCDEAVIRKQGEQIRASYSASLLKLATGKQTYAGVPLAFGEGDTKGRIRNLAKWKQPKVWISIIAIFICIIVAVVCFVNPKRNPAPAKVVGTYDVSTLGGEYLKSGNPAYEIGANIYGRPVFVDCDAAFRAMKDEYRDAIDFIGEQFDLRPITKKNYNAYKVYGAQIVTEDESLRKRCVTVAQFLDIYENSFEYGGQVAGLEVEEGGLLGHVTVPMTEENYVTLSKDTVFISGTSYVTYACQYMTPLSSTLSFGDDGNRYIIGEDSFTIENRSTENQSTYHNITWQWQPFPWTDEEWCDLYVPVFNEYKISEYYEEMLYQPISEGYCILWLDGQLCLMKLNKTPQKTPYVWSIYLLMPESWKNASQSVPLNSDMTKYLGMTYQRFKEGYQTEAIHYHANFYMAQMQEGDFNVIFNASNYDEKLGMAVLAETDEIFRVDSKLGALLSEQFTM